MLTPDIGVIQHPFSVLGMPLGKTTVVMRLADGSWLVHSAGPLSPTDLASIRGLGEVVGLLEANRMHDTFSRDLRRAFPAATYCVPPKFPVPLDELSPAQEIKRMPALWAEDLTVLRLAGVPILQEHVMLHRPSRTLILGDLIFNLQFGPGERVPWALRLISGLKGFPGTSRLVKLSVKDRAALRASVEQMLAWDFDRVIVAHGAVIEAEAKAKVRATLAWLLDTD